MHHHRHHARITSVAVLAVALATSITVGPAIAVPTASEASRADELGPELIPNGDFASGHAPWWTTADTTADTSSGALCVQAPGGTANAWDTIVGIDGIPLVAGESYRLSFRVSGTAPVTIRALVQQNQAPWTATFEANPTTEADLTAIEAGFTSTLDWPAGQIVFQIGGADAPWTFCLDDVSFRSGPPPEPHEAETHSRVRVNQYGYLPDGPKRATLLVDTADAAGVPWTLRDASGAEVATGTAEPFGDDRTVGSAVQLIAFDDVAATGEGFTLEADGETSRPFAIRSDLYAPLAADALHYFLLARSGIELEEGYAGEGYARPAGHAGEAPNRGDLAVGCQAPQDYYQGWTCDGMFDVSGGWYDAGDHGKYVVNGGIAVHQLLDAWESAERAGATEVLADGALSIPEAGNGVPDVLDEARWELEWMQRMQVPASEPYAGLVFHKVQDDGWSGLPTMPWLDDKERQVHRPSTAAALNFAAVAAKGSRLFAEFDEAFADELLADARVAWAAALETPDLFASPADGNDGGGPYDDQDVDDEFYWAAVELYLTTGEDAFADVISDSPEEESSIGAEEGFSWGSTAALGRIDLALVESDFAGRDGARASVVAAADDYLKDAESAFGHPYRPTDGEYAWGSNSSILNNQVVLAVAYEITGDVRYRDAVVTGMDYLLGRNGMDLSYITGYGTDYAQNQHHRWMAPSLDASLPPVADGTVSGGPNSSIEDPVAQQLWPTGCTAQLCYVDDIQSWSTNEMTVNWNSALSWVSAWLAIHADGAASDGPPAGEAAGGFPVWLVVLFAVLGVAVIAVVAVLLARGRRAHAAG